jgi:hypothetical protein
MFHIHTQERANLLFCFRFSCPWKTMRSYTIRNFGQADYSACNLLSRWYLSRLIQSWRWRWYVPPKRRLTFKRLHGVMCEKMAPPPPSQSADWQRSRVTHPCRRSRPQERFPWAGGAESGRARSGRCAGERTRPRCGSRWWQTWLEAPPSSGPAPCTCQGKTLVTDTSSHSIYCTVTCGASRDGRS